MIDIAITDNGTLLIVHDKKPNYSIEGIEITDEGIVRILRAGEVENLQKLVPRMLQKAMRCSSGMVVEITGWEVSRSYTCDLFLPPKNPDLH